MHQIGRQIAVQHQPLVYLLHPPPPPCCRVGVVIHVVLTASGETHELYLPCFSFCFSECYTQLLECVFLFFWRCHLVRWVRRLVKVLPLDGWFQSALKNHFLQQ